MIPAAVIDTSFFMAALSSVYTGDEQTTAMSYSLSYCDAAYLELALRHDLPLKTFDSQLQAAFERV